MDILLLLSIIGATVLSLANGLSYDEDIARRLVHFCGAVYCVDSEAFGNAYYDLEFNFHCDTCGYITDTSEIVSIYPFEDDHLFIDTEGLMTYDSLNNAITIVFAGTDPTEILDVITDIELIRVEYPGCAGTWWWEDDCTVHKGFYKAYTSVADKVYNQVINLKNMYNSNPTIEITGHSLGGAMAILCALDLAERGIAPTYVYTFGQPRVGDDEFVDYYNDVVGSDITFRVTHDQDPVPLVPWKSWGWNYWHMAREVYYPGDPDGSYTICDTSGEDDDCINQHNWWDLFFNIFVINDHLNYLDVAFLGTVLECNLGIDFDGNNAGGNLPGNYSGTEDNSVVQEKHNITSNRTYTYQDSINVVLNWTEYEEILYDANAIKNSLGLQTLLIYSLREAAVEIRFDLGDDWDMNSEIINVINVDSNKNHTILISMTVEFENEKQLNGFWCDYDYIIDYFDIKFKSALSLDNVTTVLIHDDSNVKTGSTEAPHTIDTGNSNGNGDNTDNDGCDCSGSDLEEGDGKNDSDSTFGTTEIIIAIAVIGVIAVAILIVYVRYNTNKHNKRNKGKEHELSSKDQFNWRVKSASPLGSPMSGPTITTGPHI